MAIGKGLPLLVSVSLFAFQAYAQPAPPYDSAPPPPPPGYAPPPGAEPQYSQPPNYAPPPYGQPPAYQQQYQPPPPPQAMQPPMQQPPMEGQSNGYAPPPPAYGAGPQPQSQNGISFVSGGIGDGGREAMHAIQGSYNLRMLFARRNGEFLANIHVQLHHRGETLLDTVAQGPFFLARVPPGRYRIVVDNHGRTQTRQVSVGPRPVEADFYWGPR